MPRLPDETEPTVPNAAEYSGDRRRSLGPASAAVVALVHTPAAIIAMLLWAASTHDGRLGPMHETLVHCLPAAGATVLVSGVLLRRRGVHAAYRISALVAFATIFCIAFSRESAAQSWEWSEWAVILFTVLPVPLVFAVLMLVVRIPRGRLRLPAAWVAVAAVLLLIDGAMRYSEAQEEQEEAAAALAQYETLSVLDAPGWRLIHATDKSDFPELVYRDLLGRTVLLGSEPHPFPAEDDPEEGFSADVLAPEECGPGDEEPFEESCEARDGLLVAEMRSPSRDREITDDVDRWPFGWTEVRMASSDGRYVRLRSDSPGVDLVGLVGAVEETASTDPEASVSDASCLLRCPAWRNYPS